MKRLLILLTVFMFVFVGCGTDDKKTKTATEENNVEETETENDKDEPEESEESQGVEVDKGLLNVSVTLPASFFDNELMDIDEAMEDAKADGIKDIKKNDDGSLTYKMSKSDHKKMMKEMEEELKDSIDEMKNSDDFASVEDITHNKDFSEFTMVVNQAEFESGFDGFAAFGIGFTGVFYQLFNGADPDNYEVVINIQDADTEEVFESVVFPEALDDMVE